MFLIKGVKSKISKEADKTKVETTPEERKKKEDQFEGQLRSKINKEKVDMNHYLVKKDLYYCHEYIEKDCGKLLFDAIENQEESKWVSLPHARRRLQKWGGDVEGKGLTNISEIPSWLTSIIDKLEIEGVTDRRCNHFLINEYKGATGIMPHTDGPLYYPYVSIISLGSPVLFKFFKNWENYQTEDAEEIFLVEDSSLFIFTGDYYDKNLHTIQELSLESFQIPVAIVETQGQGFSAKIGKTQISNFPLTSLYSHFFKPLFEESGQLGFSKSRNELIDKMKDNLDNKVFNGRFTIDLNCDDVDFGVVNITVSWIRDTRISLTVRYVYPAISA